MIIRSKLIPVALLSLGAMGAWPGAAFSAPIQADIPYATSATGEQLKLDLYLPEQAGAPLLVWLHGGGWENGNKSAMP
ncbi:MAG TPA: alpha/beta hydrolase, partial [Gammaproteobacteria bacterium]|nr:alpha/beta hydrolase [Gammaproteobacteria bacterium]